MAVERRTYNMRLELENQFLAPYAAKNSSKALTTRKVTEASDPMRLDFQRDRDRIIHSRAFRRLMHKTQVFIANKGDHFRNRLTHTLEVSQIARSISSALGLNEHLTEAIALGHDLGHTPFGHISERVLHEICTGQNKLGNREITSCGGFKHNYQSVHIIDNLEQVSSDRLGMNLTLAVREGILKHTGPKIKIFKYDEANKKSTPEKQVVNYSKLDLTGIDINKPSFTLEGQVVAISDEIAQVTHDLEDGLRAKIIKLSDIEKTKLIRMINDNFTNYGGNFTFQDLKLRHVVIVRNTLIRSMIGYLIDNVVQTTISNLEVNFPDEKYPEKFDNLEQSIVSFNTAIHEAVNEFQDLLTNIVISSEEVSITDSKAEFLIEQLFSTYYKHPQQLPTYILEKYYTKKGETLQRKNIDKYKLYEDPEFIRLICDHIAGMTDQYASRQYNKLYSPEFN
ncbi:deoxyguanosinetriphosphate triphosphohydrolase [Desulfotomaculum defluvii]